MKTRSCYIRHFFFALFLLCAASVSPVAYAEEDLLVKRQMDKVFQAYRELRQYTSREEDFLSSANEKEIHDILFNLRKNFGNSVLHRSVENQDPGYASTLKAVAGVLDDAQFRFDSGKKRYALWRVRSLDGYCISCHSRNEVQTDFTGGQMPGKNLTSFEKGEFYFATRQFEKAAKQFLNVARKDDVVTDRLLALRKWLLIYTRVHPDPTGALKQLNSLRKEVSFAPFEDEEIRGWITSLRRWKNKKSLNVSPLRKAENLIRQGLQMENARTDGSGTVELLRATAILHNLLEEAKLTRKDRGHVTYLLGKTYSTLPPILARELPDMFLEECIREYPGTKDAKGCYNIFYQNKVVEFSGSAGTKLPDDIQLLLRELYKLAHEIPESPSRV